MRNTIMFLVIGTVITLILIILCSAVCAALVILLAKLINLRVLTALPFSIIGGMILSFFFYGKIMKKILNKYSLDKSEK